MLFTSANFAFLYLPIVFLVFFAIGFRSSKYAAAWLFLASVFFYGYWMPKFTALLLGSIVLNFGVGFRIATLKDPHKKSSVDGQQNARRWLIAGISINLLLLGYFKYANFFMDNLMLLTHQQWKYTPIILPIGISFFTFTQIAFLVDTYQKGIREYAFIHYGLFVTYFPHLIAGPVLHHAQMMPQFNQANTYKINTANLSAGLAVFTLGLFKKIVMADGISPYADAVFNAADAGAIPAFNEAWIGALAYTFQLYFDFSGYSDMAIGLSWMFNIRLPYNFNSPYQATNIADFWHRWHMSLSSFLRDYLYIPLGGNRKGPVRRYINLFVTMALGGLWHGAGYNFIFWGCLHGIYLSINHGFHALTEHYRRNWAFDLLGWLITFLAVVVAWVFFRAVNFSGAINILSSMLSPGSALSINAIHPLLWNQGLHPEIALLLCAALGSIAFLLPNSNRIGERLLLVLQEKSYYRPVIIGMAVTLGVLLVVINSLRSSVSAFIYFNF